MFNRRVSVIMSVYNSESFLREAVDSILSQTFKDFEFVIINDGSTDGTRAILESYKDSRIVLVHQGNMGLTRSLNKGISMARGKYIARQDADDISMPNRLQTQFEYMETNVNIGLVGSYYFIIDENGKTISEVGYGKIPLNHKDLIKNHFRTHYIGHGTFFFRKSITDFVGIYDEVFRTAQDMDFEVRVAERFEIANIPKFLYKWRKSKDNVTAKKSDFQVRYRYLGISKALLRKAERVTETVFYGGLLETLLANYYRTIARYYHWKYRLGELDNVRLSEIICNDNELTKSADIPQRE